MSNVIGKVGNVEFSISEEAIADLEKYHNINAMAEVKAAIEKEMSSLHQQFPDAPIERGKNEN